MARLTIAEIAHARALHIAEEAREAGNEADAVAIEREVLADIQHLASQGVIYPRTDVVGTRPTRPSRVDLSWFLTRSDLEIVVQYTRQDATGKRDYLQELVEHRSSGLYTLLEAADYIATEASEHEPRILKRLKRAALNDELPMYLPGSNQRLEYGPQPRRASCVHTYYDQACWSELNAWLDRFEPRISCRFPKPKGEPIRSARKPIDRILRDVQQAYDSIRRTTGKAPSQRAVAEKAGYARDTVASRWPKLKL